MYEAFHFGMNRAVIWKCSVFIRNKCYSLTLKVAQIFGMYVERVYIQVMSRMCL